MSGRGEDGRAQGGIDGLDGWWPIVLGLGPEARREALEVEIRGEELAAALAQAKGWGLVEDQEEGEVWLTSRFEFPVFEAAALFTNFLFASFQMTTYALAFDLTLSADAEARVRLSGPGAHALTRGAVLFASVLSQAFYLTREPARPAEGSGQ